MGKKNENDEHHGDEDELNDGEEKQKVILSSLDVRGHAGKTRRNLGEKIHQDDGVDQARNENDGADDQAEAQLEGGID